MRGLIKDLIGNSGKDVPGRKIEAFARAVVLVPVSSQDLPREVSCGESQAETHG
jgi:hypothetical protein